ncbi:ANTAR domain-containing protein [Phycicoccus sp. Root101]|uniref:ANTAR domain-containing protein n=1 Tax=Phycicoccus sp. Root101 TaxID=1736421 RepID=UPI00138F9002|nr:ANTAR domain-containing protein [Phycicoccus sp. Root101]
MGHAEADEGQVTRLYGFVVDITDMLRETAAAAVAGALEHRAVIEQAKGALMLSFGINDEAAFELLRTYSSRSNIKLAVVAERIAQGLSDPQYSSLEPGRSLLNVLMALNPHPDQRTGTEG